MSDTAEKVDGNVNTEATHVDKVQENLVQHAARGTEREHELTLFQAIKKYPAAIGWSVFVSLACVMEGYDTAFIGALIAQPTFQRDFGVVHGSGYQIEAKWQSALTLSGGIGILIGSVLNGYCWEWLGMKRTMLIAYVAVTALTFILVFADSLPVLLVGQILCGIPWGIFGTTAPTYASEVCPVVLRGYLGTFINITWIVGQLVSAGILRGVTNWTSSWAWRIMFAGQWFWPVPLFIGLLFCPESPWWLIRKDRLEDAEHALARLFNNDGIKERLAMMIHTHEREKEMQHIETSYLDCFRGVDLRRTEIAFAVMTIQIWSGLPLQGSNTYFFEQAGLSVDNAFSLSIGYYVIGFAGTVISWFLITWFGRRFIFIVGLALMSTILFVIGFVALSPPSNEPAQWAQAVLLVIWVFVYDWSVGPLAFLLVSESSSTRLRAKTVAIGRNGFYLSSIIFSVITPYILSPTEANLKGKTAFVYGGTSFCALVWAYFRLPEFKDRTYEELDILFERKLPANKFRTAEVSAYSSEERLTNV